MENDLVLYDFETSLLRHVACKNVDKPKPQFSWQPTKRPLDHLCMGGLLELKTVDHRVICGTKSFWFASFFFKPLAR